MEVIQSGATVVGYWAIGAVILYLTVATVWRCAFAAGDYVHDLGEEIHALFGRIVFGTFSLALLYLMIWGCYLIGEYAAAFVAGFF